ncbi:hypothetical protein [Inhella gelatinilytica]|uniref:hypothetical protein n=1 Tax=Inhella gelatinilytica TaxID=2795030 RepID=UPI001C20D16D|nr:hypothetical protein [Inhella gelatinilytica]
MKLINVLTVGLIAAAGAQASPTSLGTVNQAANLSAAQKNITKSSSKIQLSKANVEQKRRILKAFGKKNRTTSMSLLSGSCNLSDGETWDQCGAVEVEIEDFYFNWTFTDFVTEVHLEKVVLFGQRSCGFWVGAEGEETWVEDCNIYSVADGSLLDKRMDGLSPDKRQEFQEQVDQLVAMKIKRCFTVNLNMKNDPFNLAAVQAVKDSGVSLVAKDEVEISYRDGVHTFSVEKLGVGSSQFLLNYKYSGGGDQPQCSVAG